MFLLLILSFILTDQPSPFLVNPISVSWWSRMREFVFALLVHLSETPLTQLTLIIVNMRQFNKICFYWLWDNMDFLAFALHSSSPPCGSGEVMQAASFLAEGWSIHHIMLWALKVFLFLLRSWLSMQMNSDFKGTGKSSPLACHPH